MAISKDISGSYTLSEDDDGSVLFTTAATTITIPTNASAAIREGDEFFVYVETAAAVSLSAAGGVTLNSIGTTGVKDEVITLRKVDTDEWIAWGGLS